jgi:hypothetical protein
LGQKTCSTKEAKQPFRWRSQEGLLSGSIPTFASHLPQLLLQMLESQEPEKSINQVELKNLTFENEPSRNRDSDVKFAPRAHQICPKRDVCFSV